MVVMRLQRVGRKGHAEFRVVVVERTRAASSPNCVEVLGSYSPHTDTVSLNKERVTYWLGQGVQPSDTVHNLLVSEKLLAGPKRNVLPKNPAKQVAEAA